MLTTETSARIAEGVMILPFLIMGLSHIIQPTMWREFFTHLHAMGAKGVIYRTFMLELIFALLIVTFHLVWSGLAILLTIYGIALMLKITLGLLNPNSGLHSMAMAERHGNKGFIVGGFVLFAMGLICIWLLVS